MLSEAKRNRESSASLANTIVGGMKFDERDLFKLLGVSVDREGLFTATFVSSLLARAHPRLETLLRLRQGGEA